MKVALIATLTLAAVGSGTAAVFNVRHWWHHRRRPLIQATGDDLVDPAEKDWPLRSYKWPDPRFDPQASDRRIAARYARLCRERAMVCRAVGQALLVLGGAWLGVQLPTLDEYLAAARAAEPPVRFLTTAIYWANTLPLLVIAFGVLLLVPSAAQFDRAELVYRKAAQRPVEGPAEHVTDRTSYTGFRDFSTGSLRTLRRWITGQR